MSTTATTTMNGNVRKVLGGPALTDLRHAWGLLHVIAFIAASDLRARYRRSVLGPFWMTLGTAAGTLGLGLVWSELLRMERASFVPSLTCGLILWQLLSGCILESTTTYCEGEDAVFTWTNPDPRDGDTYLWRTTTATGKGEVTPAEQTAATTPVLDQDRTCIEVVVVRSNGKQSDPAVGCVE